MPRLKEDLLWMEKALRLAKRAHNQVSPNPNVGCVIVKNSRVVGQGFHQRFGGPHAEVLALRQAGKKAHGATVFLTLEPCCHENKKTPPCVPQLVASGVSRVVIACKDPNPKVNGRGIVALKKKGIRVDVGAGAAASTELIRPFSTWVNKKRPFVFLKMAMTLDGRITAGTKWISSRESLDRVQQLRAQADAILVGANTVHSDNPRLSCRGIANVKQPLRVILDGRLQCPLSARVFRNPKAIIATTQAASKSKIRDLEKKGIAVWVFPGSRVPLDGLLEKLAAHRVASLMVEGGAEVASEFLREKRVDRAYFFAAPLISGNGIPAFSGLSGLRPEKTRVETIGPDALFTLEFRT